jgi:hypothetical protein
MKIYLASLSLEILLKYHELYPQKKLNVLRSFGVPSKENLGFLKTHRQKIDSLILDSGTYTLNNKKSKDGFIVTLEGYKKYALAFGHYFDFIFNFDSKFTEDGFETNIDNQRRLEEAGLHPVPVVHDIYGDEVNHYIEKKYPLVAIGSFQITSIGSLQMVVEKLHRAGIQIHLFGNTSFEFLAPLPIHSCDSTSWAMRSSYGYIRYWNPANKGVNKTDEIYLEEYLNDLSQKKITISKYKFRDQLNEYLGRELGLTVEDLYKGKFYQWLVNTHYYTELEERMTELHKQKGFDTEIKRQKCTGSCAFPQE